MNVSDLRKVLGIPDQSARDDSANINETAGSCDKSAASVQTNTTGTSSRLVRVRRQSMEQLDLIKVRIFRTIARIVLFITVVCRFEPISSSRRTESEM